MWAQPSSPQTPQTPQINQTECREHPVPPKPLLARSIAELSSWATLPEVDKEVRCHLYIRSAFRLFEEAHDYWQEGDLEYAYIYYLKFATLCIQELPRHPGYRSSPVLELKTEMTTKAHEALSYLEELKGKLEQLYEALPPEESTDLPRVEDLPISPTDRRTDLDDDEELDSCSSSSSTIQIQSEPTSDWSALRHLMDDDESYSYHYTPQGPLEIPQTSQYQTSQHQPLQPIPQTLMPSLSVQKRSQPKLIPQTQEELAQMMALRRVYLNERMLEHFLQLFVHNTTKKVESCGILSGVLCSNHEIRITTLILPKQSGTANSCHDLDEVETFTYQTENGLMPIGWIHTHPTQDCFMSSVDLHMQYGYQVLLPEAIAIVMAPRRNRSVGIFRITPRGMRALSNCRETGFHPHLETGLYQKATHVQLVTDDSLEYQVVDLR